MLQAHDAEEVRIVQREAGYTEGRHDEGLVLQGTRHQEGAALTCTHIGGQEIHCKRMRACKSSSL
eukprot:3235005-Prymnesium_polylepis.1